METRTNIFKTILLALVLCGMNLPAAGAEVPQPSFQAVDIKVILEKLPPGERWIRHVNEDLLRFWEMPTALGSPVGDFPTYRCNDGSLYSPENPCPELLHADPGIVRLDREYVRAKSRQVYAYGIAYHLTGREDLLRYAKRGADWLLDFALDHTHGGACSWFEGPNRRPSPAWRQRTSQDMAYAVSGLAFFYYLTRDKTYLKPVIAIKKHIFDTYYEADWDLLAWVRERNADGDSPLQKELVSQLDQVYGYMLWTTPALPDSSLRREWEADLLRLAQAMREQFFSQEYGLYWGAVAETTGKNLGMPHTDFGHSIKTLWLTYRIGLLTGHQALVDFAKPRAVDILRRAYLPHNGSWARGYALSDDRQRWIIDENKEWWSLCELDQTAATLALVDPSYAACLPRTYDYWFSHMVDEDHGGIWHMVNAADNRPDLSIPKQHSWKNAFHVFEHALVGYITAQELHGKPVTLYYAFRKVPDEPLIHPYLYFGRIRNKQVKGAFTHEALSRYRPTAVIFTDIR